MAQFGAARIDRNQFLGTSAWFYFVFNAVKVPLFLYLGYAEPDSALITGRSLTLDLRLLPTMALGAVAGKSLLAVLSESLFENLVIGLAAAASFKLAADGFAAVFS